MKTHPIALPLIIVFTLIAPMARAAPPGAPSEAALFSGAPLDSLSVVFAYDKIAGNKPDFREYAEHRRVYLGASICDRDRVLQAEVVRLKQYFGSLSLAQTYVIRLNVPLQAYDSARGGIPVELQAGSYVPFSDPATGEPLGLMFTNKDQVSLVPTGGRAASETFAREHSLWAGTSMAAAATLEMVVQITGAPPEVGGTATMLDGKIVAARLVNDIGGAEIYDFGMFAAPKPVAVTASGKLPVLRATDVQRVWIGMAAAEAGQVAGAGKGSQFSDGPAHAFLYFDGLETSSSTEPRCGIFKAVAPVQAVLPGGRMGLSYANPYVRPGLPPALFQDCLAFSVVNKATVGEVEATQYLSGTTVAALRAALESKYGQPTYVLNGGTAFQWIGVGGKSGSGEAVEINAGIQSMGSRDELTVFLTPYWAPAPPAAKPGEPSAPKL